MDRAAAAAPVRAAAPLIALAAAAGLGGCIPQPDARALASTTLFACEGGVLFSVQYSGADRGRAHLATDTDQYELRRVRSASGARYSDGGVEFWEHQGRATLRGAGGGPFTGCRIPAASGA